MASGAIVQDCDRDLRMNKHVLEVQMDEGRPIHLAVNTAYTGISLLCLLEWRGGGRRAKLLRRSICRWLEITGL